MRLGVAFASPTRSLGPEGLWLLVHRGLAGRAPPSPSCRRSRRWVLSQAGGPARESRRQPATGSARGSQLKRPRRPRVGPATQVSLAGLRRDTPMPVPARPRPHRAFVRRFRSVGRLPISLAVADRAGLRVTPLAGRRELPASRPASRAACLRQARPGLAWPGPHSGERFDPLPAFLGRLARRVGLTGRLGVLCVCAQWHVPGISQRQHRRTPTFGADAPWQSVLHGRFTVQ